MEQQSTQIHQQDSFDAQHQTSLIRQQIITHIMKIKKQDEAYARAALREYVILLPWLDLNDGIKQAMKDAQ